MPEDKYIEASLSYEEKNALRYVAGYITKAQRKKIKHSSNPLKKEFIGYLVEMSTEDELSDGMKDESEDI